MKSKLPYQLRKRQFFTLFLFGIFILLLQLGFTFYKSNTTAYFPEAKFISNPTSETSITEFNPNDLDEKQWENLGFSERQVATILKYKDIVGGNFSSKEQLKKCYAISEDKFSEIEPYVLLPEKDTKNNNFENFKNFEKKELNIRGKFNPDFFSQNDWENLGFSYKQSAAIIKYKQYLGGSFVSKEKFKECFIINEENYRKLSPFLLLPEKTPENFEKKYKNLAFEKPSTKYFDFDPNILDKEGWQKLGFSEKQAVVIVNYRDKNLKGSFRSIDDIKKCFVISEDKFNEFKPFIKLIAIVKNQETAISNIPVKTTETRTDFSKTDLNKISYKELLEFGFDEKSAGSFIGFRNKLGGFINKNQILETYNIDKSLAEKIINISNLNTNNIQKYTLLEAPEDWLKNHPYFRYYANKIIYFRISYPNEKQVIMKSNIKPEDEAKMRLYLK